MKALRVLVLGALVACSGSQESRAQVIGNERHIEEQARMALKPTETAILEGEERLVFDYGVWVNYLYTDFHDDDNDASTEDVTDSTFSIDPRFWLRASLRPPADGTSENEHSVYFRYKDLLTWRDPTDSNGHFDQDGPHVDYLFLTLDFRPYWIQVGRRFFGFGQGLAYSDVGDGIELMATFPTWNLMGLVARSLPHQANIDFSLPGGKNSGRTFYGIEGKYIGIPNHGIYSYIIFQRDDGDEDPEDTTQNYDYDSEYFGLGSEGTLLENLRYATEVIFETGHSAAATEDREDNIRAMALDVSLTYDVQLPMQPTLYGEFAFGSGDSDRTSVTDTIDGNTISKDTNFLYFGYLPTGYALSPRVSNLRMLKIGMAIKPLERMELFKELTTSVDFYRYYKDESKGGIFDLQASRPDRDVGSEVDLTLSWPVLSDLTLTVEYGHFEPGDAYPLSSDDDSDYFSAGITTTF